MIEFLEMMMVLSFGISWPFSILKSYRSRTAKGKSLFFLLMICFGYICGIVWKLLVLRETGEFRYPGYFYILNFLMISCDVFLYFRNRRLDAAAEDAGKKPRKEADTETEKETEKETIR